MNRVWHFQQTKEGKVKHRISCVVLKFEVMYFPFPQAYR